MGSKKSTFSSLAKTKLHQTPYFISLFYFLIYFYYFIFFTTLKIPSFLIFLLPLPLFPLYILPSPPSLFFFPPPHTYHTSSFLFSFLFFPHHPRTPFPFFLLLPHHRHTSPLISVSHAIFFFQNTIRRPQSAFSNLPQDIFFFLLLNTWLKLLFSPFFHYLHSSFHSAKIPWMDLKISRSFFEDLKISCSAPSFLFLSTLFLSLILNNGAQPPWPNSLSTSRSVGGGLDLLVFLSLVEHRYFLREVEGENVADRGSRERRNEYLIHLRMNSCYLSWASYCSLASEFWPNEEAGVSCFAEFFAIFWLFIRFGSAGVSVLIMMKLRAR